MRGYRVPAEHSAHHDAGAGHAGAAQHLQRVRQLHLHRADLSCHPTAEQRGEQLCSGCACQQENVRISSDAARESIARASGSRAEKESSLAAAVWPVSSGERLMK